MKYMICANYNKSKHTIETSVETEEIMFAIETFFKYLELGFECDLVNVDTGEILAYNHGDEQETTDEMALMFKGYLAFMEE